MKIKVNDQQIILDGPCNLEQLLKQLQQLEKGLALAVNRKIISRSNWADFQLDSGDNVTLIRATAGG